MTKKNIPECHYDILGNEIRPGVAVAAATAGPFRYSDIAIYVVNRITPKMANISRLGNNSRFPTGQEPSRNVSISGLIVVDQEKALIYALKM